MKTTRQKILLFIALVLLGACSAIPQQELVDPDWCYTFNLASSDYSATITSGQWINGVGLQSVSGQLNVTYNHNQPVSPGRAIIYLSIDSDGTPINVSYNVFGMTGSYSDNIPSFISTYELPISPTVAGTNGQRASINLSIDPTDTITITALAVSGTGANPFPSNACAPAPTATSTSQPLPTLTASNTPTNTPTGTATNTPTNTPIVTSTPDGYDYCYRFDFRAGMQGWFIWDITPGADGEYVAGQGWSATDGSGSGYLWRNVGIRYTMAAITKNIKTFTVEMSWVRGTAEGDSLSAGNVPLQLGFGTGGAHLSRTWATMVDGDNQTLSVTSPTSFFTNNNDLVLRSFSSSDNVVPLTVGGYSIIHAIQITGFGTSPFPTSNCGVFAPPTDTPTPTGSPTDTPAPTSTVDLTAITATPEPTGTPTPSFGERCNFINWSFDDPISGSNWSSDGIQAIGSMVLEDNEYISQTVILDASLYYLTVIASIEDHGTSENDGSVNFIYDLTKPDTSNETDDFGSVVESYFAYQGNQVQFSVPITTAPGSNQFTISADLDSVTSVKILSVCLSEFSPDDDDDLDDNPGQGGWQTCDEKISQPTSVIQIGGWIRFLWDSADQTIQCVIMPPINAALQNFISFAGWVWNFTSGLFQWGLGRLLPYLTGHIQNFFRVLLALLRNGFGGLWDLFAFSDDLLRMREIAVKSSNIITGYTSAAKAYMNTGEMQVSNFVVAYTNTPATAPYGLPDCINNPYNHDWCAVHWVMENTFLFGLVGGLIIPTLTLSVDLVILMYFSNVIRKFIKQLKEIFND